MIQAMDHEAVDDTSDGSRSIRGDMDQISECFNCYPPSLEEYLGVVVVN